MYTKEPTCSFDGCIPILPSVNNMFTHGIITQGITSLSVSKISFIYLMGPISFNNNQNTIRGVI